MAGCHVVPPSIDTSTPATCPPKSAAVPVRVTLVPLAKLVLAAGEEMVTVGLVMSVDALAAVMPLISVAGCTPMSASRLTTSCCRPVSGASGVVLLSWLLSRPQANWMVPAANTSAPLAARYSVMWCVVVPAVTVLPKSRRYSGVAPVAVDRSISPPGRYPLSRSSSDSYPMVCAGMVAVWLPAARVATRLPRQMRSRPCAGGTCMARSSWLAWNMMPLSEFSGRPPLAGGENRGSR